MQLTASEDIEAPLDRVFAAVTDFEGIERQALRRGVDVRRVDSIAGPASGMTWQAAFGFRGKPRKTEVCLSEYHPPEQLVFDSVTGGLEARFILDLVALSRGRTRLNVSTQLKPTTLSSRLLVQSMKLAKGGIDKRFRHRMAALAKDLENRVKHGG